MNAGPVKSRRRPRIRTVGVTSLTMAATAVTLGTSHPASADDVVSGSSYTVTNVNNGKCVDARSAGTANGTVVQQYACNSTLSQSWLFQATSGGYFQVGSGNSTTQAWDVTDVSTADGAPIQLWTYSNGNNQQWQPVKESSGAYHFVNRNSGKCLNVPGSSTADSVQLQQATCNGSGAQAFNLTKVGGPAPGQPDLGPNVIIFDPSMPASTIQNRLNSIFSQQEQAQFGAGRYAIVFKPGTYNVDVNVGFFTQVLGLGLSPDNVTINGAVHVEADWFPPQNATHNFWRAAENLSVTPNGGADRWAVSQAAPYRRMHVRGDLILDDGGWASGGFIADSKIDGQVRSGSQQQWLSRNATWGSWNGSNWNMVFVGVVNAPSGQYPNPPFTVVPQTPVVREKPFLYVDSSGAYNVFVPSLRNNTQGITWGSGTPAGASIPLSQFYIAKPGVSAATINSAMAEGKHVLFTPGIYHLSETIRVNRADTVVLGLGLASLVPDNGIMAMSVADVDGVKIAGILIDAAPTNSPLLMQVGPSTNSVSHASNPTSLHDVFVRIGGGGVGRATTSLVINSNNVIADHLWLWRADHTDGVGWDTNTADTGLIVNGSNVTTYGLFVEHYKKYQTIWNGNGGRTYFYQNEMPYDPPNQAAWMNGSTRGYAAYKVANSVTSHEAWGLGSYCFFNTNPSVVAERAFEVPDNSGVRFHNMVTVSLGGKGTINRIINNTGNAANSTNNKQNWVNYP